MSKLWWIPLMMWPVLADAKQTRFDLDRGETTFVYDVRWKDALGQKDSVSFSLPIDVATSDKGEETWVLRKDLVDSQAKAVRNEVIV